MEKARVLYISQEITPYVPEAEISNISRNLPEKTQESGKEVRIFMPRYGCINERRHQLHEVIRLSGLNIVIDDADHPLIIKVASIPSARMQVYFIDNEEYFERKTILHDNDGNFHADNDERAMFFCRGVLETVKKLGWNPDIIHCHGWMTSLIPLYLRKKFSDDPVFSKAKIVTSVYDRSFEGSLDSRFADKILMDGFEQSEVSTLADPTYENVAKFAIENSDAAIIAGENVDSSIQDTINSLGIPFLGYQNPESYFEAYSDFYNEVLEENQVLL
jgi:starch synthase